MSGIWRYLLLIFFGATGIVLALCLGLASNMPLDTTAGNAGTGGTPGGKLFPAASKTAVRNSNSGSTGPMVERIRPLIAQQSTANTPFAQASGSQNSALNSAALAQLNAQGGQSAQNDLMEQLQKELQKAAQGPAAPNTAPPVPGGMNPAQSAAPNIPTPPSPRSPGKTKPRITRIPGEGDNNLSIHIQDSDIRDVLELLSEQGGLNILPAIDVQGKVSASLNGVDIDTALDAILRSTGFVSRRDGQFIYVGTPQDFKQMEQSVDKVATRIYRLNYVRSSDIQVLVTPLLTPGIGTTSVTAPADEGMADDSSKDGGNKFAGGESILVHDYVAVLDQIDQVISEIDKKPAQVAIEAMILRVTLDDKYSFGVDFELLRNNLRFATGSPLANLNTFDVTPGGLKFAYLDGSTGAFVSALETIGDTDVIASPKVMVIDKARAEILIGQQLGYVNTTITETSTAQNVQFLEVGAQLRLRPFISADGQVRMEVHPELSTGEVKVEQGLTLPNKDVTQVTTNIIVPDGCTVVIGGLMREDLATNSTQVPFFGSLPGIGFLFRDKTETMKKQEIIVLITPHIVCEPDACCEGDRVAAEFHRRHAVYADSMSPLYKRYIGRKYYRLAQAAWANGDQVAAMRFIDLAIHFDSESRAAIDLRTDIWNGRLTGPHELVKPGNLYPPAGGPGEMPSGGMPPGNAPPGEFGEAPWQGEIPGNHGPYGLLPSPEAIQQQTTPQPGLMPTTPEVKPQLQAPQTIPQQAPHQVPQPMPQRSAPPIPAPAAEARLQPPQQAPQLAPPARRELPAPMVEMTHPSAAPNPNTMPSVRPVPMQPQQAPGVLQYTPPQMQTDLTKTPSKPATTMKLGAIGSGTPLMTPVAKVQQPPQLPSVMQPTRTAPPILAPAPTPAVMVSPPTQTPAAVNTPQAPMPAPVIDRNVRPAVSVSKQLDSDKVPNWMLDEMMKSKGQPQQSAASSAGPTVVPPARLAPNEARPLTPETK